jgi:hypothetical protein
MSIIEEEKWRSVGGVDVQASAGGTFARNQT